MRRVPWVTLGALLFGALAWAGLRLQLAGLLTLPSCPFKALTGLPCASCGLTRCGAALARGHWREAFYWHPVGTLVLAFLPLLATWDLWRALRGEAYPGLPEKDWARWAVVGLLAGTWCLQVARGI